MAERERPEGRATTWPWSVRARKFAPWLAGLPALFGILREHLARWIVAEAAPGRLDADQAGRIEAVARPRLIYPFWHHLTVEARLSPVDRNFLGPFLERPAP